MKGSYQSRGSRAFRVLVVCLIFFHVLQWNYRLSIPTFRRKSRWLVWVDSSTQLGYSEWDDIDEEWGVEEHEDYDGESDIAVAKQRVEDTIAP